MDALIRIKHDDFSMLIYPWIFLPLMMPDRIFFGSVILVLIGVVLFAFSTKKVSMYEDFLVIEKYRYVFLKVYKYTFNDVLSVYIYDAQSISRSPVLIFFFNERKEKIPIPRHCIKSVVTLLISKQVIVKSNRNELIDK